MAYKIAVCEDCETDRAYLGTLIREWTAKTGRAVQVSFFPSAESFLFQYADEKDFAMLILDIEMGDMDGVTMARRIRKENDTVQIIFVTGYTDYIAEGYEVAALHYLVKPVNRVKFEDVLERAVRNLQKNEQVLFLEAGGEMVRVPVRQIRYIEVRGNYVTVHAKESYTVKKTLREMEQKLDERFFRLGRSVIVNLYAISRVTKTGVVLTDQTRIPLPRGMYEKINRAVIEME